MIQLLIATLKFRVSIYLCAWSSLLLRLIGEDPTAKVAGLTPRLWKEEFPTARLGLSPLDQQKTKKRKSAQDLGLNGSRLVPNPPLVT